MVDIWWGICEPNPNVYDFSAYVRLIEACERLNLHVQATLSFHACGGNVGDSVSIPLPTWINASCVKHNLYFTDRSGLRTPEYISFGADHCPLLPAANNFRTPLQAYADFTTAFIAHFSGYMTKTITEIQIGMGPCGELRYPSYPQSRWKFPGIGEFQCYDPLLRAELRNALRSSGRDAEDVPSDTGHYNSRPDETGFFTSGFKKAEGRIFLDWYSQRLLNHANDLLSLVRSTIPEGVKVAMKVSGVHWWRFSRSRAAEATTGYVGKRGVIYREIARLCRTWNVVLDFTCLEMRTMDQPMHARCGPRQLVAEVFRAAKREGVSVAGENALEGLDWRGYAQVVETMRVAGRNGIGFTLLRLNERLMGEGLSDLQRFVKAMERI